ncbi:MAG TPA: hypothetical protein VF832_10265, partial [Longimicrobiales bacterium]
MIRTRRAAQRRVASRMPDVLQQAGVPALFLLCLFLGPAGKVAAQQPQSAAQAQPQQPAQASSPADSLYRELRLRSIGPANTSGRITALAVPETPGHKVIYAGSAGGGLWKTANAGVTWEPSFNEAGLGSIGDVAVAPSRPNVVWVGTGERNSLRSSGWGDGVWKSEDAGRSWKRMGLEQTRQTGRIVIDPRNADVVYVAALGHLWGPNPERGIYKTTDGGKTWQRLLFVDDTSGFVDFKLDPSNPDVLYAASWHRLRWGGSHMEGAGAGSGLWKSVDAGKSWKRLTDPALKNGLPGEGLGRIGIGISPAAPHTVYAVIQVARGAVNPRASAEGGLFRSDDSGASWTRVNDLSAIPNYYYNEVWADPSDAQRVWLTSVTMDRSRDGGRTFSSLRAEGVHVDNHALWIDPSDPQHVIVGNDGGVYISFDGGERWAHQLIPVAQFYEADLDSTRAPFHVCGGLQDNGVWCGASRTRERQGITTADWYQDYGGDGFHSAVAVDSPTIRFAESQFGDIARWDVNAWRRTLMQPEAEDAGTESAYPFRWDWNTPFILSAHDPRVLYLGANYLFKFTDHGRSWRILGPDMTRMAREHPEPDTGHTGYHALHAIAESPLDAAVLWTGSDDGLLWTTSDGGKSWRNVTAAIPDAVAQRCVVGEIAPSHFNKATAYVTYDCHDRDDYDPHVFRTTDGGASFVSIAGNLPRGAGSHAVLEDYRNPRLLFLGSERGLYATVDGGAHWSPFSSGLPTVAVRDLDEAPVTRELVVPTFGRGIWLAEIGPLQELADTIPPAEAFLFEVPPARQYAVRDTYGSEGATFYHGENPPYGASISYWLPRDLGRDVTLTIRRPRSEATSPAAAPAAPASRPRKARGAAPVTPPSPPQAPAAAAPADSAGDVVQTLTGPGRPGLHRVVWDLRSKDP